MRQGKTEQACGVYIAESPRGVLTGQSCVENGRFRELCASVCGTYTIQAVYGKVGTRHSPSGRYQTNSPEGEVTRR